MLGCVTARQSKDRPALIRLRSALGRTALGPRTTALGPRTTALGPRTDGPRPSDDGMPIWKNLHDFPDFFQKFPKKPPQPPQNRTCAHAWSITQKRTRHQPPKDKAPQPSLDGFVGCSWLLLRLPQSFPSPCARRVPLRRKPTPPAAWGSAPRTPAAPSLRWGPSARKPFPTTPFPCFYSPHPYFASFGLAGHPTNPRWRSSAFSMVLTRLAISDSIRDLTLFLSPSVFPSVLRLCTIFA